MKLIVNVIIIGSCQLPKVSSKFYCPTNSSNYYSIPSIPEEVFTYENVTKIPNHLSKTINEFTYIFPTGVKENCSLPVTHLEFCYVYANGSFDSEEGEPPGELFNIWSLRPECTNGKLSFLNTSMARVKHNKVVKNCSSLFDTSEKLCCGTFSPNNFHPSSYVAVSTGGRGELLMYNELTQNIKYRIPQYIIESNRNGIPSSNSCSSTTEQRGLLILKFVFSKLRINNTKLDM